jgi:hypothetical protein
MTEPTARDAGSFEIACHKVARLGFARTFPPRDHGATEQQ